MKFLRATGAVLALMTIAACSGGGTAIAPLKSTTPTQTSSSKAVRVKATILLPRGSKKSTGKSRKYVSPGTQGLIIQVNQTVSGSATTVYSDTGYDLTQNSAETQCTAVAAGTQCTIYFNAPPTTTTSTDAFYIYAYDMPQTAGPIAGPFGTATGDFMPSGNLLSQDVGTGTGDPVPYISGDSPTAESGNTGIIANQDNALTFVLLPVVASEVANIGSAATPSKTLALSVAPGSVGGTATTSNTVDVDGDDADGNQISAYVTPTVDNLYVNPITEAISGGSQFAIAGTGTSLTSATSNAVMATYAQASGDAPTSLTSTVPEGTLTFSDSFTGGFYGTSTIPGTSVAVTVDPLFAYAPSPYGLTQEIYAYQHTTPTGGAYSVTIDPSNNSGAGTCPGYSVVTDAAPSNDGDAKAHFTVTIPSSSTTACLFDLSDGISTVQINVNTTTATIVIPKKTGQATQYLYVGEQGTNSSTNGGRIDIYSLPLTASSTPIRTLTSVNGSMTSLKNPSGSAFDSAGDLFVTDGGSGLGAGILYEFKPPFTSNTVGTAILTGLDNPQAPQFDANGNLYIAERQDTSGSGAGGFIEEYQNNGTGGFILTATYSNSNSLSMNYQGSVNYQGVAVDGQGNVYASSYYQNKIDVFAQAVSGSTVTTSNLELSTATGPQGMAFDTSGNLYVENYGSSVISVFKNTSSTPMAPSFSASASFSFNCPANPATGIAFDANGNLYVPGYAGEVEVFNTNGSSVTPGTEITDTSGAETNVFGLYGGVAVH